MCERPGVATWTEPEGRNSFCRLSSLKPARAGLAHNYLSRRSHRSRSVDFSPDAIIKKLRSFYQTKWFNLGLLVLLGLVASALFPLMFGPFATACLGLLLIPIAIFVLPYWLGERSLKRFALNGLVVLLIATLVTSAFQTQTTLAVENPILTSSGIDGVSPYISMDNGTVTPYHGAAGQTFTYRVRVVTTGMANNTTLSVYLNYTQAGPFSASETPLPMTQTSSSVNNSVRWYEINRTESDGVYYFYFSAKDTRSNFTLTYPVLGPLTASVISYYVFWLPRLFYDLIIPFSFYYVILFMYWYTVRTRKMRSRMIEAAREKEIEVDKGTGKDETPGEESAETKTKPPPRGLTRKASAFTCTNCGADVTADDAKCPKCGAVFED